MLSLDERRQARQSRARPWLQRSASSSSVSASTTPPVQKAESDPASKIPRPCVAPVLKSCLKKAEHKLSKTLTSGGSSVKHFGSETGVKGSWAPPSQMQVASRIPIPSKSDLCGVKPRRYLDVPQRRSKLNLRVVFAEQVVERCWYPIPRWEKALTPCAHQPCLDERDQGRHWSCSLSFEGDIPPMPSLSQWAESQYHMGNDTLDDWVGAHYRYDSEQERVIRSSDHPAEKDISRRRRRRPPSDEDISELVEDFDSLCF